MPAAKVAAEKVTGHRHRVGWDGNVVIGGLLLHQVQTSAVFGLLASFSPLQTWLPMVCNDQQPAGQASLETSLT